MQSNNTKHREHKANKKKKIYRRKTRTGKKGRNESSYFILFTFIFSQLNANVPEQKKNGNEMKKTFECCCKKQKQQQKNRR